MAKVNDVVRFLNSTGGGRISRIEGNMAYVEDEDGFEQPVLLRECVVVDESKPKKTAYDRPVIPAPSKEEPKPQPKAPVVEETEGGDKLNITLAYEPREIKHLNTTTFYAYLVKATASLSLTYRCCLRNLTRRASPRCRAWQCNTWPSRMASRSS